MYAKKLLTAFFCFLVAATFQVAMAQGKTITGKITNSKDGQPIEGASVLVKGTRTGTTTKADGSFTLSTNETASTLVVSSIGYETKELKITEGLIAVGLIETSAGLGEVVVVGYGTQKKREITSAITSIKAEEFNKGNISNVAQLLQGKVAGLSISRPGGDPNRGFEIRLRGLSTLGAGTSPLVVIDGQVGADLNTVDPNDIASIDVLKDGSSAAIYGTRGSAGVIIVTTKGGQKGATQVTYNGAVTVENPARFAPSMSASQYREEKTASGLGVDFGGSTNWGKAITRTGISHTHNLSLSGGVDKTNYSLSLNIRNAEGVAIETGFKQLNARGKITHKALNNKLVLNLEMTSNRKEADYGQNSAFQYAVNFNPTAPIYTTPGSLNDLGGGGYFETGTFETGNPYSTIVQNSNSQEIKRTNISGSAELEIIKGLKFLTRYAIQSSDANARRYSPRNAFNGEGYKRSGFAERNQDISKTQLYENTLSYQKKISTVDLSFLAGYSYQDFLYQGNYIGTGNFVSDLGADNLAFSQDYKDGKAAISSYKTANKLVAFFGRLSLNYNNFAFLSASLRREGSTQFGDNNKWGYFPAVSAGLDIGKLVEVPSFNTLKLRASYGITGQLPPNPYLSQLVYGSGPSYPINAAPTSSYGPQRNDNPNLKWERKAETDIGLDFSAFRNRLTGTLDYYIRNTKGLIFQATVASPPAISDKTWLNVGDLRGNGFEFSVNYDVLTKEKTVSWTTGLNFATNKNKLTRLDPIVGSYLDVAQMGGQGGTGVFLTRVQAGEKIGNFYGGVYKGLNSGGAAIFYKEKGGDTTSHTSYKTTIGNGLPKFEMGWNNSFNYKKFEFNFFLRGSFGHDLIHMNRIYYEYSGVIATYNGIRTKYYDPKLTSGGSKYSSLFVEKGSFVKLDNATLAYNFSLPQKGMGSYFKNIRAYVSAYNLFMITGYTGVDPEVRYSDSDGGILAPGIDRRDIWVLTRSITLGVNIGF